MILLVVLSVLVCARLCSNTCNVIDQYCSCDDTCLLYGDCCTGHSRYDTTGDLSAVLTCKPMYSLSNVWIVDKCSIKEHPDSDLCSNIRSRKDRRLHNLIPVMAANGVTYDNLFCAKCNGVTEYRYHVVNFKCRGSKPKNIAEMKTMLDDPGLCEIVSLKSEQLRSCDEKLVRKCPKNSIEFTTQTSIYCERGEYEGVTNGWIKYRNMNCCECWNVTCFPSQFDFFYQQPPSSDEFSYLLNFNEWDKGAKIDRNVENSSVSYNQTSTSITDKFIHYISLILSLLSILSVVLLIIIYSTNAIFRNFGGYLTICLCACLFLMMFLNVILANVTITSSILCSLIGILQHYVALSNFIWMGIFALDLLQTFGFGATNRNKRKTFRTFLVYFVAGFGLATLVVGAATVSEYNLNVNSTLKPEYGGRWCWFTSKYGGILWYFGPVTFIVAWNLVACVVVFYKLSKTAKECQVVKGKESKKTLWLCIRLTAVFGIGYLIQIVAVMSGVKALILVGSLLNCGQGCLLAACFVWTKKVRNVVTTNISSISTFGSKATGSKTQATEFALSSKDLDSH